MLSRICNILIVIILVVVLLVAGALLVPRLLGYQIYGVLSGSMEPVFHVGSVIYVEPVEPESIAVGDAITFHLANQEEVVATHRVVAIDASQQQFSTKGDANDVPDAEPVTFDRFIGKAVFSLPYLGFISFYVKTKVGIVIGVSILVLIILLSCIGELTKKKKPSPEAVSNDAGDDKK